MCPIISTSLREPRFNVLESFSFRFEIHLLHVGSNSFFDKIIHKKIFGLSSIETRYRRVCLVPLFIVDASSELYFHALSEQYQKKGRKRSKRVRFARTSCVSFSTLSISLPSLLLGDSSQAHEQQRDINEIYAWPH